MNIVITGGSSGLGLEILKKMLSAGHDVYNLSFGGAIEYSTQSGFFADTLEWLEKRNLEPISIVCDVSNSKSVKSAFKQVKQCTTKPIDILINCAGVNGIEYLENMDEGLWDKVLDTNAKGIFLMSQVFLEHLKETKGTIVNIISNAAYIPMTSSLAYNASKGAAHIMTKQMARELTKLYDITVFGIAPNRMKNTRMSDYIDEKVVDLRGWTKEYAQEYQRKSLPAKKETDPKIVAELICWLLERKERHDYLTGCIIPAGA